MTDNKNAIWNIADNLRGNLDGWDFKNYILGALFFRYICDKFNLPYFKNALQVENLDIYLASAFRDIEKLLAQDGLFQIFDINSPRLGDNKSCILKILQGVNKIDFYSNKDTLGDIYEFLISMYASKAGKSGGEFFTPQEVSQLLMQLATSDKDSIKNVYDPACGSGSLLLQATKFSPENFYGQEINVISYNLCRINMLIHGVKFNIACGDTLTSPKYKEFAPFDLIVSNPPYSISWRQVNDERFSPVGVLAPKSKGDFAFVLHSLHYLSDTGTAAIVVFPGILYRSGAEQGIRKYLVDNNFVDAVIQLPDNLFFGTSIATCILILKKNKTDKCISFLDASKEFIKSGKKNCLSQDNIAHILKLYKSRINLISCEEVARENYNLSVSGYTQNNCNCDEFDIKAINAYLKEATHRKILAEIEFNNFIDELEEMLSNDNRTNSLNDSEFQEMPTPL